MLTTDEDTQPVEPRTLRLSRAVHDLRAGNHCTDAVAAINACARLERLMSRPWPERVGALIEDTSILVRDARRWLVDHGYISQAELDRAEKRSA